MRCGEVGKQPCLIVHVLTHELRRGWLVRKFEVSVFVQLNDRNIGEYAVQGFYVLDVGKIDMRLGRNIHEQETGTSPFSKLACAEDSILGQIIVPRRFDLLTAAALADSPA